MPQNSSKRNYKIVGNWKMHGTKKDLIELQTINEAMATQDFMGAAILFCLPATLLEAASHMGLTQLSLGAQACHDAPSGAQTGQLSALQLHDAGAQSVICGHSETRAQEGLRDKDIYARACAAWSVGLRSIICIGETQAIYEAGQSLEHLTRQLVDSLGGKASRATAQNCWIAYEPIWAIGSGRTPTAEDIAKTHTALRQELSSLLGAQADAMSLLYGGSVTSQNVAMVLGCENVDGVLVGGASLRAKDFLAIMAQVVT